ncbi:sodium:calcium antiporter [archaeon]|jgi:cation:H+ antiporter|nr:sodium:calcium antiporter [archaeon]MBT3451508.1 sodium:calcium antiporter [archaeon]MBT6869501.1 sodium:calcium antiporter [archaeon]MBT7193189.1 sodium:calcium antiporter [archaeon]MBT7380495.1 sodium:calcium antiporter [archaeon]
MLVEIITLLLGIIAVLILADVAVRNCIRLAAHFGLSGTFIGLTVLSIGTSIPEIMTAVLGSINILKNPGTMNSLSGLIIGTNVGSDIFQQSFVLGLVGLVGTIAVFRKNLLSEVGALIAGASLMWIMCLGGFINRWEAGIMLLAYAGYMIYIEKTQIHKDKLVREKLSRGRIAFEISSVLLAFIVMGFASNKVVQSAEFLVSQLSISASLFGVLMLGVAAALPELSTALIAAHKHKKDISTGVLIGSNVTNPLLGLGLGALISGYAVPNVVIFYDLPVKIGMALLIFYFLYRNEKLNKWEALILIKLFIVYLAVRGYFFPIDF